MEFPEDLRYTKEHEWVRPDGGLVIVGITDFAQDALGDVVYVDLPAVGATVTAGTALGEVESTKSVSDVFAPVSGTVAAVNPLVDERPELVNEQPYGDGWLLSDRADGPRGRRRPAHGRRVSSLRRRSGLNLATPARFRRQRPRPPLDGERHAPSTVPSTPGGGSRRQPSRSRPRGGSR